VEKVMFKALAKQPENRYQAMDEFAAALKGLLAGKYAGRPMPEAPRRTTPETATIKDFKPDLSTNVDSPSLAGEGPGVRSSAWLWGLGVVALLVMLCAGLLAKPVFTALFPTKTPSATPTKTLIPTPSFTWTPEFTLTPSDTPTPLFTPTNTPLPDEITDSKGVSMHLVPAGTFTMGSDEGKSDEQPIHDVYLDAYYMDTYEVTNALYKACVDAGMCDLPINTVRYKNLRYENHPVVFIEWYMAKSYCEWRGAQLSTEAQWEKAARGTDERTYPWGEGIDQTFANYGDNVGDTTPVGSYENGKSPYGLYDMAGNVWEWVGDWYSATYYQVSPLENPMGPNSGQYHVQRGGPWDYYIDSVRSASRSWGYQGMTAPDIGFRCSRSLP
jgi:formylglycine-generating enzyme required for sulfatase activity